MSGSHYCSDREKDFDLFCYSIWFFYLFFDGSILKCNIRYLSNLRLYGNGKILYTLNLDSLLKLFEKPSQCRDLTQEVVKTLLSIDEDIKTSIVGTTFSV